MASMTMTMTASFLGASAAAAAATKQFPGTARRSLAVRASKESEEVVADAREESNNTRRDMMFAVAAAAACSIAKVAMAIEPKAGTPEAKKKYAPVCVTMPTARICRN